MRRPEYRFAEQDTVSPEFIQRALANLVDEFIAFHQRQPEQETTQKGPTVAEPPALSSPDG